MSELISCFYVTLYLLPWDSAYNKEVCVKDLDRPIGSRQNILHCYLKPHEIRDRPPSLEEQAGFHNGRSCNRQIFTLWNILEQCKEFQKSLAINFIDFKKAFDSVHRESILGNPETLWHSPQDHQYIHISEHQQPMLYPNQRRLL